MHWALLGRQKKNPQMEWHKLGVRNSSGVQVAANCIFFFFGVGHMVAGNGQIYGWDTSVTVSAIKVAT